MSLICNCALPALHGPNVCKSCPQYLRHMAESGEYQSTTIIPIEQTGHVTYFKQPVYKSNKYLDWIRQQECWYCGTLGVDPHHIGTGDQRKRARDDLVIPLCRAHHDMAESNNWNRNMRERLIKIAQRYRRQYEGKNL